jgi:hypothetical protein
VTSKLMEERSFADLSALIEGEKAAALAAFDQDGFRAEVVRHRGEVGRHDKAQRSGWRGSPLLAAVSGCAVLLVAWAVLVPEPRSIRQSIDVRTLERALLRATVARAAGAVPTPVEPALSDDVWAIERALLEWRRQQNGSVDVERALCLAARLGGGSRSCPSPEPRDAAAPGARQRLERALIEIERDGTIHRALVGRRRT